MGFCFYIMLRYLLILFVLSQNVKALNISLKLFLNTDNCFACEGSLRELKSLDTAIKVEINVLETSKKIVQEYLEKFDLKATRYTFKYHKKINFDQANHKNSYFKLIIDNKDILTFYGEKLNQYISGLNSLKLGAYDFNLLLPDTNILSSSITLFVDSNLININDFKLGKNITYSISPDNQKIFLINKIFAKQLGYSKYFQLAAMDSSFYHQYRQEAIKRGVLATFEQSYLHNGKLFLLFSIPYYYFRIPNVLRNDSRSLLLVKDLNSESSKYFFLKDDHIMSSDSTMFFVDNSKCFFVNNSNLFLPLFASKYKGQKSYRYMKMKTDGDTIKLASMLNYVLDKKIVEKYKLDDGLVFSNKKISYSVNNKMIYHFKSNEIIDDFIDDNSGGDILDAAIDGCFIRFLTLKGNTIKFLVYDRISKKKIIDTAIKFSEKISISSPRIFNASYIVSINELGNKLLFTSIK